MTSLPIVKPREIDLDKERLQRAGQLLKAWTESGTMPGAAIVVGRHGKIVEPQFFGKQGPEKNAEPVRRDDMFLLASITKPIVYMSALKLVERGDLVLTNPVTHYIPDFAAHHKESILVHHLFTHTSGMPDMLENNVALRQSLAPLDQFIQGAIYDTVPLFPTAGTSLSYQSMGTLIVAEIIQRLTRKTIAQHVRDEINQTARTAKYLAGSWRLSKRTAGACRNAGISDRFEFWLEQQLLAGSGRSLGGHV